MKTSVNCSTVTTSGRRLALAGLCGALLAAGDAQAQGSKTAPAPGHAGMKPAASSADLQRQLDSLRRQVAELTALLKKSLPPQAAGTPSGMAMGGNSAPMTMDQREMGKAPAGMAGGMRKMEMMDKMPMDSMRKMEMGKMPMEPMRKMDMDMSRMAGMGGASPGSGGMSMSSAVPGNPGSSHLYHIGATGFFLDQATIELTTAQRLSLNQIRERALAARSTADRKVEQAEEELWALTAATEPDAAQVAAKVSQVESMRTEARLAFIRSVGEATQVLTPAQRAKLLGVSPPAS